VISAALAGAAASLRWRLRDDQRARERPGIRRGRGRSVAASL